MATFWKQQKRNKKDMGVSKNRGVYPPKWMIYFMEKPIKMDDLEVPLFLETLIWRTWVLHEKPSGKKKGTVFWNVHFEGSPPKPPTIFVDLLCCSAKTCRFVFGVKAFGKAFRRDGD